MNKLGARVKAVHAPNFYGVVPTHALKTAIKRQNLAIKIHLRYAAAAKPDVVDDYVNTEAVNDKQPGTTIVRKNID